jgi:peptidoglycan hydrolase-like protein with peptidoglycan-binding domain
VVTGGTTAFLVALFYVSANAIWYQPHAHRGAFFPTRDFARAPEAGDQEPETTFVIERPAEAPARPAPVANPVTAQVQGVLKELGFYAGAVDGLSGPATSKAIEAYRAKVGLSVSTAIDEELLVQLGIEPTTAGIRPTPAPRAGEPAREADVSELTKKVQAGLKAFGNDGIEVDGILGARTKSAISEFQSIFGLPVTGEPDKAIYAKMREIGLTK